MLWKNHAHPENYLISFLLSDASILHEIPIPSLKFRVSVVDDTAGATETDVQSQLHEIICDFKPRIEDALTIGEDESQTEDHSIPLPKLRIREQPPLKRKREETSEDDESSRPQTPVTTKAKASPFVSP